MHKEQVGTTAFSRFRTGMQLRSRLLGRVKVRLDRSFMFTRAKRMIQSIQSGDEANLSGVPGIVLSSFSRPEDFLVLSYLFRESGDLAFISPRETPDHKIFRTLRSHHHVLTIDPNRIGYSFFKEVMTTLREFNRPIVVSADAAKVFSRHLVIDPVVVVRIAMKANIPIIPVNLIWYERDADSSWFKKREELCTIDIGKKMYISPRTADFKDIFFNRRGARKFQKLSHEDLAEIGRRVFAKVNALGITNGQHLPKKVGAGAF